MNILFIHSLDDINTPDKPLSSQAEMQSGISYISALLKEHGNSTKLLVLSRLIGNNNAKRVEKVISSFKPSLIAFSAVTTEYRFIENIASEIKRRHPSIFLFIGGPHASLVPESVIKGPFDALCIGEGEYPSVELASQLEKGYTPYGIQNLWIKNASAVEKNPTRPLIYDLDSLPFPDRSIWEEWTEASTDGEYPVLLGRGCPYSCTYCCNHALRKLAKGTYVRFRSPDNIIKELSEAPNHCKNIYLEVETIGANKPWFFELCDKLEKLNKTREEPFKFRTNLRVSPSLDIETVFNAFKKANILTVNIGVESGSQFVRQNILKRDYTNDDIIKTINTAGKLGIGIHFYNLIGVPGETLADFKKTIELNRICQPEKTYAHIFFPYPGTDLYETCRKNNLLPKQMPTELERCKATLGLPHFSNRQIQNGFIWFDYDVYKGHRPLPTLLVKVFISWLRSNVITHKIYRMLTSSSFVKNAKRRIKRALFKRI